MASKRIPTVVRNQAQRILEGLSIADIRQAMDALPSAPEPPAGLRMQSVFDRAEKARSRDEILGLPTLPAHLYVIDAILQDRALSGPLLDCLIQAVRAVVYRGGGLTRSGAETPSPGCGA